MVAGIHINFAKRICSGRLLVLLLLASLKIDILELARGTILTDRIDNNGGGQKEDNLYHNSHDKEEDELSNINGWKISDVVDKQARVFDNQSKTNQLQLYHYADSRTNFFMIPTKSSKLDVKSKVGVIKNTPLK